MPPARLSQPPTTAANHPTVIKSYLESMQPGKEFDLPTLSGDSGRLNFFGQVGSTNGASSPHRPFQRPHPVQPPPPQQAGLFFAGQRTVPPPPAGYGQPPPGFSMNRPHTGLGQPLAQPPPPPPPPFFAPGPPANPAGRAGPPPPGQFLRNGSVQGGAAFNG